MTLKSTCLCLQEFGSLWITLPPEERHAYRVQCIRCNRYIKWGAATELAELQLAGAKVVVVPIKPHTTIWEALQPD
jgi:hypothetical protein